MISGLFIWRIGHPHFGIDLLKLPFLFSFALVHCNSLHFRSNSVSILSQAWQGVKSVCVRK
ncbi:hypothetical protein CPL00366_CDS0059 [Klebsiella phage RareGolfball]